MHLQTLYCGGDIPTDSADDIEELKEVDLQKLRMSECKSHLSVMLFAISIFN